MESSVGVYPPLHRGQRRRIGKEAIFRLIVNAPPSRLVRCDRVIDGTGRCEVVIVILAFFGIAPHQIPLCFPQQVFDSRHTPR